MIWLTVSLVKQEQLMVCLQFLVRLNSDLLCVNQLPVCTAGTANRLIERSTNDNVVMRKRNQNISSKFSNYM